MTISLNAIEKEFRKHIFDVSVIQTSLIDSQTLISAYQSEVNAEITDLNHILEYCSLSSSEISKIGGKLKKLFKVRREIKETYAFSAMILSKLLIYEDLTEEFNDRKSTRDSSYQEESRISFNRIFQKGLE